MKYTRAAQLLSQLNIESKENEVLAPHTSFKIGGPARLAVYPKSADEAVRALSLLQELDARILVLGNGTNVLIADAGFDGAAVILTGMHDVSISGEKITAAAGASLTHTAGIAAKASLSGLEFAWGIPGTVGGGVYMNAGAYGGEIAQVAEQSSWYDLASGTCGVFVGEEQDFSYRNSAYMGSDKVILSAVFRLTSGDACAIEAQMTDYMTRRKEKQPLELPSAGSVFKRGDGFITAQLIDQAGLKGRRVGGAEVSKKHAGFIVNLGDATAEDVRRLTEIVRDEIYNRFGKTIEQEIRFIGF